MASRSELTFSDFQRYFPYTPAALCIKECARLTALREHDCPGPILDVGCGDGLFAKVAFDDTEVWGVDIDAKEGRWASASQAYSQVVLGDITRVHLPAGFFETCIANCSLEHVPRLDRALATILASLKPGGRVLMFVPNRTWAEQMLSYRILKGLGAGALADTVRDAIDTTFRHHHLYDEAGWREVVERAGFEIESVKPVLSSATTVAFEAFLLPSLLGYLNKRLTTRWTNFPNVRRLLAVPAYAAASWIVQAADPSPTAEFLVVGRRPLTDSSP
jgi:2-polyprenyl-3-methyl-5-hydroxy-6-metoxy-1,4-benzoquinol methylase